MNRFHFYSNNKRFLTKFAVWEPRELSSKNAAEEPMDRPEGHVLAHCDKKQIPTE